MGKLDLATGTEAATFGLRAECTVIFGSRSVVSLGALEPHFATARSSGYWKDESLPGIGTQTGDSDDPSLSGRRDLARCSGTFTLQQVVLHVGKAGQCPISNGPRYGPR